MATTLINISLSEPLQTYVEAQVESGAYGTPADYLRDLILDDRDRSLARLEDRLAENRKSRPIAFTASEFTQENFVNLCRSRLREAT